MPEVELPLLSPLIILAGLLFALGCVMLIDGFVRALFGAVASLFSHIPLVGSLTASAIHNAEHAISGALGKAVSGIESNIGRQWHNLSRVLGNLWAEQKLVAQNLWHLVQSIGNVATGSDIRHLQRTLINRITHALHTALTAAHDHIGLEHWVKHLIRSTIWPRIHYFTHAIDTTIPREFGNLWGRTKAIEDSIGRLWDRVRSIEGRISTAAIAAVVATVLAAIGLDWLACRDGANRAGRSGCNLWSDIGTLLGLLGDVALFANVCAFLEFSSPFVSAAADVVIPALTTVGAGLCPGTIGPPPALPTPTLYTPPSPGVTLYLP